MGILKESKSDGFLVDKCPTIMRLVLLVVVALTAGEIVFLILLSCTCRFKKYIYFQIVTAHFI